MYRPICDFSEDLSDDALRVQAFEHALESLALIDLLYLRAHPDAPRVGPLGPPYDGLRAAGVVVGRRSTECGCLIHSSDEHLLSLWDLLGGPRPALADVDDVAAWRVAELRFDGDSEARIVLREDRDPRYQPSDGSRHYVIAVLRGDGREERFS
jgi:hypothetical protein